MSLAIGDRIRFNVRNTSGTVLHSGIGTVKGFDRVKTATPKKQFDAAYVNVESWDGDAPKRFHRNPNDSTWIAKFEDGVELV